MKTETENNKINDFLAFITPAMVDHLTSVLRKAGFEVNREGTGMDLALSIKSTSEESDQKILKFYLHNLLMEIATIDRDEDPVRFDENLCDFEYFLKKSESVIKSKLTVLSKLVCEEDVDVAIEKVLENKEHYERIRVWRFDKKPT
jgi:hypothetical protein